MLRTKLLSICCVFVFTMWILNTSASIDSFVQSVKNNTRNESAMTSTPEAVTVFSRSIEDPISLMLSDDKQLQLLEQIKKEAKKNKTPPINARVDPVWKAIPGYNGLEVDIEKTFKLAKQSGSLEKTSFVYKETPPEINLEDLGAYPIYKGNPKKPMVSLMINVAWGNEFIPKMLEILQKEHVYATFFLDGSWLQKNIEVAKEIQKQGHELSNHAYSHKNMSRLSRERAIDEIVKTQELLKTALNVENSLFAPPSGDFNQQTVKIAYELKLKTVLWTVDTVDWRKPDPNWILTKISTRLEPGAMILMHPTDSSSKALHAMIKEIKRRGLAIGTVSELLSPNRILEVETGLKF